MTAPRVPSSVATCLSRTECSDRFESACFETAYNLSILLLWILVINIATINIIFINILILIIIAIYIYEIVCKYLNKLFINQMRSSKSVLNQVLPLWRTTRHVVLKCHKLEVLILNGSQNMVYYDISCCLFVTNRDGDFYFVAF